MGTSGLFSALIGGDVGTAEESMPGISMLLGMAEGFLSGIPREDLIRELEAYRDRLSAWLDSLKAETVVEANGNTEEH